MRSIRGKKRKRKKQYNIIAKDAMSLYTYLVQACPEVEADLCRAMGANGITV